MLGIQCDNGFPGLQQIEDEELHQIAFPLAGVTENEDVGRGLILVTLIEVHEDVAAVLVPPDIEALCVRFAGIIEGIKVCHGVGRQDSFKLRSKGIVAHGTGTAEALLLAEQESVHIELAPHQLRQHVGLQQLQRVMVWGSQLDVDRAVEQRLLVAVAAALHGDHVLQVRFCNDGLPQVVGVRFVHTVLVRGIVEDTILLGRGELPGIDTQGDAVLLSQMPQQSLLVGLGRIFPQCPYTTEGITADKVVGFKLDHGRRDHIQKGFDACSLPALRRCFFRFLCQMNSSFNRQQGPSVRRRDPRTARWSRSAQSRLPASF